MEFFAFAFIIPKKNSPTECNHEIYDKKMVGHHSLPRKMKNGLRNVKFENWIDYKNLEYFITMETLTERQIRGSLILSKYDFAINYITGKNNEQTDAFSMREQNVLNENDDKL